MAGGAGAAPAIGCLVSEVKARGGQSPQTQTDTNMTDTDPLELERVQEILDAVFEVFNNFDDGGVSSAELVSVAINLLAMAVRHITCPHCRKGISKDIKRGVTHVLAEASRDAALQAVGSNHVH
jgi:hypothetical protein